MARIVGFPSDPELGVGFQRVKSCYSVREISAQFGIGEQRIRRWAREGIIPTDPSAQTGEIRFDFRALKQFRRVRELTNRGMGLRQIEAELRGQLNLFPEAEGRLIRLPLRLSPFEEAAMLHEQGDPRAEECYLRAVADGDSTADALCNLGILEYERGNLPAALDRLTQALAYDPRHFEGHFNLARLYFEAGDLRLAQLHFELAARLEPGCFDCRFSLAAALAMDGRREAALEVLREARLLASDEDLSRLERLSASLEVDPGA